MKALRIYQTEALGNIDCVVAEGGNRALVVMATGLGKTVVAAAFVREWIKTHSGRIGFFAQSQDILAQAREREFGDECPDLETGLVTSDIVEKPDARMLFITLQTMQRRQQKGKVTPTDFELIIVDEAHHGQAATYRKVITFFTPVFLMGLTATPNRADRQDIRDIFGKEVYEYPLARALADGWLAQVDYRVMADNVAVDRMKDILGQLADGDRSITRRMIDSTIFLAERMEEVANTIRATPGKRKIVFCRTIEHIRQMHHFLPEAAPYHSKIGQVAVLKRLKAFRAGEMPILLVVDKLNEGVDIPDADVLAFLRSTQSMTVLLQQLGRGLRKTLEKDRVTVLDYVANCDRILNVAELGSAVNGHTEGGKCVADPLRLEGLGWNISFEGQVRDVLQMLEILNSELYHTIEEAMVAVQKLEPVPTITMEYESTFRQDRKLPSNPWILYKDKGWKSMAHFLGVEWYETLDDAKAAMLRLMPIPTCVSEYQSVYKQDPHLPSQPDQAYSDKGWIDWWNFFDTNPYETIEEAMAAVKKLKPVPKTLPEYRKVYRQDKRLLCSADRFYQGRGWTDWKRYLGTAFYDTIEEAMAVVQKMDPIPTTKERYHASSKQDRHLPLNADAVYRRKGWVSWPHFLGQPERNLYERIEEAMIAVRKLGITTQFEYRLRRSEDSQLPSSPNMVYADKGWVSWPDFFATLPYGTIEESMEAVQHLEPVPTKCLEYLHSYLQNLNLPRRPEVLYREKGWQGWPNFLGVQTSRQRCVAATNYYPTIAEAMAAIQKLEPVPTTNLAYRMYRSQDPHLPRDPRHTYGEAWKGWGHFLGTGRVKTRRV